MLDVKAHNEQMLSKLFRTNCLYEKGKLMVANTYLFQNVRKK